MEVVGGAKFTCCRCAKVYDKKKGNFYLARSATYKGFGYIPVCRVCVDEIFSVYMKDAPTTMDAVRQVCRKFDMHWNQEIFAAVDKVSTKFNILANYFTKLNNSTRVATRTYDESLKEEGQFWAFGRNRNKADEGFKVESNIEVDEDVILFWGPGYVNDVYRELEGRRKYWVGRYPEGYQFDIGEEAIIRQICNLELDINRDRSDGKPVDKSIATLNTLLGSLNLKPTQKKDSGEVDANTPFGVWIRRFENERPIPETDPELRDVDGIVKYILTWVYGHLAKMLNIKNAHSALYDKEIEKYRVQRPEFDDEDDETFLGDIFGDEDDETGGG